MCQNVLLKSGWRGWREQVGTKVLEILRSLYQVPVWEPVLPVIEPFSVEGRVFLNLRV